MIWHHNDYSEEALADMQKEAEERVREMQTRARLLASGGNQNSGQKGQIKPMPENKPRQNQSFSPQRPASPPQNQNSESPFENISKAISSIGEDRLIVLAVLWLLWNEHADAKLLLALLYILL